VACGDPAAPIGREVRGAGALSIADAIVRRRRKPNRYDLGTYARAIFADSEEPARSSRCTVAAVTPTVVVFPLLTTGFEFEPDWVFFGTLLPPSVDLRVA
jgi:hypothetical protein